MPPEPEPPTDRFRILSFDGGGIRGLISALTITELEKRIRKRAGEGARISDYFHLFSGTSTGGLIALSLTAPGEGVGGAKALASFYTEDGPTIFHRDLLWRIRTADGWLGPAYPAEPLREAVERRLGGATVGEALRELLVTSYDMTSREPFFFKRWRAREPERPDPPVVDAALATAAAPTYFPSHGYEGRALVDGGVFANNPVVAAIVEALKRGEDDPAGLTPADLLVVSIGTRERETRYAQAEVSKWGKRGWIVPREGESPLLGAVMGGTTDAPNHWGHVLLNHFPGEGPPDPEKIGRGPRFFRWQAQLDQPLGLDDASEETLYGTLPAAAAKLIGSREAELDEIADRLTKFAPLPSDPP